MSRAFIGTGQVNYIGQAYQRPIQICNGGKAVPLFFDWNAYQASSNNSTINVKVSLQTPDVKSTLLSQVASVYIDNTNSNVPIYVYCPDTKYTAVAQPNSAGWYPLYTNAFELWVIGQGFVTGQIPQTQIFVSDLFIPPYTDIEIAKSQSLYLASPSITRGSTIYNQNVGVPALGDQTQQPNMNLGNGPYTIPLFNSPLPSGFIYLTHLAVSMFFIVSNPGGSSNIQLFIESTGSAGVLFDLAFILASGVSLAGPLTLCNLSGMQLKLDATQPWQVRGQIVGAVPTNAFAQTIVVYTTNPN